MKKRIILSIFAICLFIGTACFPQDKSPADNSWLNGKWEGTPPQGGKVQMDLQVNGNQIKGTGFIVQPGIRSKNTRQIEGSVNGNKVDLTYFGVNETIKYDLKLVNDNLVGTGTNPSLPKPIDTIFLRIK